jgi:hypothetical protein
MGFPEVKGFGTGHAPLLNATHSLRAETGSGDPIQVPRQRRVAFQAPGAALLAEGCRGAESPNKGVKQLKSITSLEAAVARFTEELTSDFETRIRRRPKAFKNHVGQSATSALSKTHGPAPAAADNAGYRDLLAPVCRDRTRHSKASYLEPDCIEMHPPFSQNSIRIQTTGRNKTASRFGRSPNPRPRTTGSDQRH